MAKITHTPPARCARRSARARTRIASGATQRVRRRSSACTNATYATIVSVARPTPLGTARVRGGVDADDRQAHRPPDRERQRLLEQRGVGLRHALEHEQRVAGVVRDPEREAASRPSCGRAARVDRAASGAPDARRRPARTARSTRDGRPSAQTVAAGGSTGEARPGRLATPRRSGAARARAASCASALGHRAGCAGGRASRSTDVDRPSPSRHQERTSASAMTADDEHRPSPSSARPP